MKIYLWILAALFIIERTLLLGWLDGLDPFASYYFEALLIAIFLFLMRKKLHHRFRADWKWAFLASLNLICGALIFMVGEKMNLLVPFDFNSGIFALLLIVVGPVIEEFLYRGLLWEVSKPLFHSAFMTLFVTSVLFSLDHFTAYFSVKPLFHAFILYQTFYTLVFGLVWGYSRMKQNSVFSALALHMLFNLGFYVAARNYPQSQQAQQEISQPATGADATTDLGQWSEFNDALTEIRDQMPKDGESKAKPAKTVPRILIADMPVSEIKMFDREKGVKILSGAAESPELGPNCGATLKMIEDFFGALLASRPPPFELDDQTVRVLETTLWKTHGYHVLGLVQNGLRKSEVIMLPMHAPPSILDGISDHKKYINNVILPEMVELYKMVQEQDPDLVLVATSDTLEENDRDLRTGGYSPADAKIAADEIIGAQVGAWTTLISSFPKVHFIVPAGNGGADSIGDRLESKMVRRGPIPAVLPFGNMIRVASFERRKDSCLSIFSNFGVEGTDVAAGGREVESWAPCAEHPHVKLTGTSQSAAKVVSFLAAGLENGVSVEDSLKTFTKESCLEDRVSLAARLPEP